MSAQPTWDAYVRGFGEYISIDEFYESVDAAREVSSYGERIYRVTLVETVLPDSALTSDEVQP